MKTIKTAFLKVAEENPDWSSYICFAEAIKHRNYSIVTITEWFPKLVDKEDYSRLKKKQIIRNLMNLTRSDGDPFSVSDNRLLVSKIKSSAYNLWRKSVLQRDGNKCVICKSTFPLIVHHVKHFSTHPELRLDVSNGVTLCNKCHKKVHAGTVCVPQI